MMLILKIITAPVVLILTLALAVLGFVFSLASWAFGILSFICAICGVFEWFIQGNMSGGIVFLALAFLVSPYGIPAIAGWLVARLHSLNYTLWDFITG